MPKVFQANIGGKKLFLFDLPIEDCETIGTANGISWLSCIDAPLQSAAVAKAVVAAAAKKLGVPTPDLPSVRVIFDMLELVDDDLPTEHAEGLPKSGLPAAEMATTG
jgi:hypothetical protein